MSYKKWIIISALLFTAAMLFGYLVPAGTSDVLSEELISLEGIASLLAPYQVFTMVFIFFKNVSAVLFSFMLSPIFCLSPIFSLTVNGGILGFVSNAVIQEESLGLLLAAILPHGIIEIPALILGEAAAFSFGAAVILAVFSKERRGQVGTAMVVNLKRLLLVIILLVPAAIIETYITPFIIDTIG